MIVSAHSMDTTFYCLDVKTHELVECFSGEEGAVPKNRFEKISDILDLIESKTNKTFSWLREKIESYKHNLMIPYYVSYFKGKSFKSGLKNGSIDISGNIYSYYPKNRGCPYNILKNNLFFTKDFQKVVKENFILLEMYLPSILPKSTFFNIRNITNTFDTYTNVIDITIFQNCVNNSKKKNKIIDLLEKNYKGFSSLTSNDFLICIRNKRMLPMKLIRLCNPEIAEFFDKFSDNEFIVYYPNNKNIPIDIMKKGMFIPINDSVELYNIIHTFV